MHQLILTKMTCNHKCVCYLFIYVGIYFIGAKTAPLTTFFSFLFILLFCILLFLFLNAASDKKKKKKARRQSTIKPQTNNALAISHLQNGLKQMNAL